MGVKRCMWEVDDVDEYDKAYNDQNNTDNKYDDDRR